MSGAQCEVGDASGCESWIATSCGAPRARGAQNVHGAALGAQATHPGAKVRLIWTNSWFDPGKEADAAVGLGARRGARRG